MYYYKLKLQPDVRDKSLVHLFLTRPIYKLLTFVKQDCHRLGKPGKIRGKCKKVWNFEICSQFPEFPL